MSNGTESFETREKTTNTHLLSQNQRTSRKSGHKTAVQQTDPHCEKDEFVSGVVSLMKPIFKKTRVDTGDKGKQESHALSKSLNFTAMIDAYVMEYHNIPLGVEEETRKRMCTRTDEIAF